jgi:hypothetical protein
LLIAKSQMERHDPSEAIQTLKKALQAISTYKQNGGPMLKQLTTQEREVRKIHTECTQRMKAIKMKEKQRARAMFGNAGEEKKDADKKPPPDAEISGSGSEIAAETSPAASPQEEGEATARSPPPIENTPDETNGKSAGRGSLPKKKRVSFADGSVPGDPDDSEPSFFEEHKEALFLVTGIAMGCLAMHLVFNRRTK